MGRAQSKRQYLPKANIWQNPRFGKIQYSAKANIWQKINGCQKLIFGNNQ
jgi:hypothetical protein